MEFFDIDPKLRALGEQAEHKAREQFAQIDRVAQYNSEKVLSAFIKNGVSESHFTPSTGYGYGDRGRDVLDQVYAYAFGAEDALVRHFMLSGTHALTTALFGILRPGDVMLSVAGKPYDTLDKVIGLRPTCGSLAEFGIFYRQVELDEAGRLDYEAIERALKDHPAMVYLQRSRGYAVRPSIFVEEIAEVARLVRKVSPESVFFVDNCYGEFVELQEPIEVGADLMAGSLIKNPGGGLAPIGGYIAGKKECVENAAYRLTSPGLGKEVGASLGILKDFYQGFFLAPTVTAGALKGAIFAANVYEKLGFAVVPNGTESRHDIIQAITFGQPEGVIGFCQGIQAAAPVDSHVTPEPWDMPGYDAQVIMAAGAFVSGSSIELSADGPIKPPYAVYFQGGLTWQHAKFGILKSLQSLLQKGIVTEEQLRQAM